MSLISFAIHLCCRSAGMEGRLLSAGLSTRIITATGLPRLIPNPCAIAVADLELVSPRKTPRCI